MFMTWVLVTLSSLSLTITVETTKNAFVNKWKVGWDIREWIGGKYTEIHKKINNGQQ